GRRLASPLRRGEPVTDARLTGSGLLAGLRRDLLALSVRPADPASADLVRTGDRVDVLAGPPQDGPIQEERATLLADDALVLAAGAQGSSAGSGSDSAVASQGGTAPGGILSADPRQSNGSGPTGTIVLAVSRDTAARLAAAAGTRPLSIAVRSEP
ncbi:MAG: hypothetical protein QG608_1334, partial [Actinomycetota bacterium]|nr:hypothetical protein [Actinomycetota bacterium]